MIRNHCRPLWKEGMFLAPQHMQQADNYRDEAESLLTHAQLPCPWGIESLNIDTNLLSSYQFVVQELKAISPSQDIILFPGNIEIPSRSFEGVLSDPQQSVKVYAGIPDYQMNGSNLLENADAVSEAGRQRYKTVELELADENTGLSERMIQIRKIRGRLLLEGEDTQGFQLLPIARIKPAPNMQGAVLDDTYIPPLLMVSACEPLYESLKGAVTKLTTLQSNLQRAAGVKGIEEWCSGPRGIELILKILAVNQIMPTMQQISHASDVSPFFAYNELLRAIGTFWTFKGDAQIKTAPFYDHLRLGECFESSIEIFRKLCTILDARGYIRRQFVSNRGRMEVDLEREWLSGGRKLYLCVSGAGGFSEVMKRMSAIKVCAPSHFVQVLQRRIQAVQLSWMRQPPSSLPAAEGAVYAEIIQSGRFWPGVVTEGALAVGSAEKFPYRLDLFVE
jgi:type VI secretion system protein ImpJ